MFLWSMCYVDGTRLTEKHSRCVPVTIGTIHIDEIINLITDEDLKLANRKWQRGIISRKVAVKSLHYSNLQSPV